MFVVFLSIEKCERGKRRRETDGMLFRSILEALVIVIPQILFDIIPVDQMNRLSIQRVESSSFSPTRLYMTTVVGRGSLFCRFLAELNLK